MELTLAPETQRLVEEKLKEGLSADEIIQAGLAAINERDFPELDQETLDAIDRAEEAIERGEVHRWEDVKEEVRAMFKRK
jgi:hypothetical protein